MIRGFIIQRNNFKLYTNFNTKKVLLNWFVIVWVLAKIEI